MDCSLGPYLVVAYPFKKVGRFWGRGSFLSLVPQVLIPVACVWLPSGPVYGGEGLCKRNRSERPGTSVLSIHPALACVKVTVTLTVISTTPLTPASVAPEPMAL